MVAQWRAEQFIASYDTVAAASAASIPTMLTRIFVGRIKFKRSTVGALFTDALGGSWAPCTTWLDPTIWGADPTGTSDSQPAFQECGEAAISLGLDINIPKGTFRFEDEWLLQNPEAGKASFPRIRGAGRERTTLKSYSGTEHFIRIRGCPELPSGAPKGLLLVLTESITASTYFFYDGGFEDLTVDLANDTHGSQNAFALTAWFYGSFKGLRVQDVSGNAFHALPDLLYDANPDFSAPAEIAIDNCDVRYVSGYGFYDNVNQGAPGFHFNRTIFQFCKAGGALVSSGTVEFQGCSFSACGWDSEAGAPAGTAYGIYFKGAASSSARSRVQGCEFDTNLTAHIAIDYATSLDIVQNRFIWANRRYASQPVAFKGVVFAPGGSGASAVRQLTLRDNFHRIDMPASVSSMPMLLFGAAVTSYIGYDFVSATNAANVIGVEIERSVWSNSGGAATTQVNGMTEARSKSNHIKVFEVDTGTYATVVQYPGAHLARHLPYVAGGSLVSTNVGDALEELEGLIGSGAASDITFTPAAGIAATDVQAAIEELVADVAAGYLALSGGTLTGDLTLDEASPRITFDKDTSTDVAQLIAKTNTSNRWAIQFSGADEDINIIAYDNGGTPTTVLNIDRLTQLWSFTGQLGVQDGTAAAPGFTFKSDTDNGAYRDSANKWHLIAGGGKNLTLGDATTAGYVGLGTNAATGPVRTGATRESISNREVYSVFSGNVYLGSGTFWRAPGTFYFDANYNDNNGAGPVTAPGTGFNFREGTGLTTYMQIYNGALFPQGAQIADGSLATPGLRFINDLNNGIYRSGTDLWSLVGGGAAQLTVDGVNSRIGVGTTTPSYRLDVNGTTQSTLFQTATALVTTVDGGSTAAFTANMVGSTGGPTTAAQNGWVKMKDSTNADIWVPVWK